MSNSQGRRIAAARTAFEEAGHPAAIEAAYNALEHRALGHEHMDAIRNAWTSMVEKYTEVPIWSDLKDNTSNKKRPLSSRKIRVSAARVSAPDPIQPDHFSPTVYYGSANPRHLFASERQLPICIFSQHVVDKLGIQVGETPKLDEAPFVFQLSGLSVAYSEVMGEYLNNHNLSAANVIIGHPQGLFYGYAIKVPPDSFGHKSFIRARINDVSQLIKKNNPSSDIQIQEKLMQAKLKAAQNAKKYQPPTQITIKTFIGMDEINDKKGGRERRGDRIKIHTDLMSIMNDPKFPIAARFAMEAYAIGSSERAKYLHELLSGGNSEVKKNLGIYNEIEERIREVTETAAWAREQERSMPHLQGAKPHSLIPAPAA